MTSEAPDTSDEDYLVNVRAQVMTRDDSKGGWVPLGGGGMSVIGLCRLVTTGRDKTNVEFFIYGHRITDKSAVLKCTLKKDLQYTRANPTFHHWKTESGRFGLTFQSSTDARIFEKGVRKVVDSLRHGPLERTVRALKGEDQDIFMSLSLPLERKDSISRPESTASTTVSTPSAQSPTSPVASESFLERSSTPSIVCNSRIESIKEAAAAVVASKAAAAGKGEASTITRKLAWYFTFPPATEKNSKPPRCEDTAASLPDPVLLRKNQANSRDWKALPCPAGGGGEKPRATERIDPDEYVEFAKKTVGFEYSYPQLEGNAGTPGPQPAVVSAVPTSVNPPQAPSGPRRDGGEDRPTRRLLSRRLKCVHCQETFVPEENRRGSCVDAPDSIVDCIEVMSCSCCARAVLYHCVPKAGEGGESAHPCVCGGSSDGCQRWTLLSLLSLVVPCLWCYWPLTLCHRCAVRCRCCGGRHEAAE